MPKMILLTKNTIYYKLYTVILQKHQQIPFLISKHKSVNSAHITQ